MPKLTIDGFEIEVPEGMTVLQACQMAKKEIPHFCYHERLSIAGNCRMCLVEMERAPKPIASCAMPAADGMVISTNSEKVQKARKGVMEFLLINHPLDCPICDQGGECDLQDQAMAYGFDRSRFAENKRAVKNKDFGPLVKTTMTRCIHCTRCVRFSTEVAGVNEIGALYRGEKMEIGNYIEKVVSSELSGNIIDLCPVGALTSKPYEFKARSWELTKTETIDVLDATGSNIRVDSRGSEVMRILPRLHEDINEEWITDKARFSYDGLKRQRLDRPYIRKNNKLVACSWEEAFDVAATKLKSCAPQEIGIMAGDLVDCESILALKDLAKRLHTPHTDCRQYGEKLNSENRGDYLFNTTIHGIEQADACLLIGCNPRWEAPLVNARLRKSWLENNLQVASIGPEIDLTYDVDWLGESPAILKDILNGKHPFFKTLKNAKRPMLILGTGALTREDSETIIEMAKHLAEGTNMILEEWNGYNILHTAAGRVGGLDLQFTPAENGYDVPTMLQEAYKGNIKFLYLHGVDEIDFTKLKDTFVVYQGHHGDKGAHHADVIFPGCAYTEKNATYVNTEGRVQQSQIVTLPPGDAKEDWKIIRAFSEKLESPLPYNNTKELHDRLHSMYPHFAHIDETHKATWMNNLAQKKPNFDVVSGDFAYHIKNYYMTDPISRASKTMAECTKAFGLQTEKQKEKKVSHG